MEWVENYEEVETERKESGMKIDPFGLQKESRNQGSNTKAQMFGVI